MTSRHLRHLLPLAGLLLLGAAGCGKSTAQAAPPAGSAAAATGRVIEITASTAGYSPATIEAKAGEDITLRFTRTTTSECLSEVVIPDLKIKKELPVNTPVDVPVKFDKAGSYGFQCGMAMVKGTIHAS
jgi:plastocyanin domain-containing protein